MIKMNTNIIAEQDEAYRASLNADALLNEEEMQLALLLQTIAEEELFERTIFEEPKEPKEPCEEPCEEPEEPEHSNFKIQFIIKGDRVQRRFLPDSTLDVVKRFLDSRMKSVKWSLINPVKASEQLISEDGKYIEGCLTSLGLKNMNLIVVPAD